MFTGLIKECGKVLSISPNQEGKILTISSPILTPEINIDDSIAINGVCQTAIKVSSDSFTVQAVHTSLEKTTLGSLIPGDQVNLELALRLSDRLGGHLVQGHVNGKGHISKIRNIGTNFLISLKVPKNISPYIILEGSICLDGISLTIAELNHQKDELTVSVIPHTYNNTTLKNKKINSLINIEVDIIAKYLEGFVQMKNQHRPDTNKSEMTESWLRSRGF